MKTLKQIWVCMKCNRPRPESGICIDCKSSIWVVKTVRQEGP